MRQSKGRRRRPDADLLPILPAVVLVFASVGLGVFVAVQVLPNIPLWALGVMVLLGGVCKYAWDSLRKGLRK